MKKVILISGLALLALTSCNKVERTFDSEIGATRDQTEVLKAQNVILTNMLEEMKHTNELLKAKQ